jgi:hypothetical protein
VINLIDADTLKAKVDTVADGVRASVPYYKRSASWLKSALELKQFVRYAFFLGFITEETRDTVLTYIDSKDLGG